MPTGKSPKKEPKAGTEIRELDCPSSKTVTYELEVSSGLQRGLNAYWDAVEGAKAAFAKKQRKTVDEALKWARAVKCDEPCGKASIHVSLVEPSSIDVDFWPGNPSTTDKAQGTAIGSVSVTVRCKPAQ